MALRKIQPQSVNRVAMLIVGQAGVGKTSLLRTLCGQRCYYDAQSKIFKWQDVEGVQPEKVCVVSFEGGLLCVRDLILKGRVEGFEISTKEDFEAIFRMCNNEFVKEGYRWIFIDSLTEISAIYETAILANYNKSQLLPGYKEYNTEMTNVIKRFRDMQNFNVVFTCLSDYAKGEGGQQLPRIIPNIKGNDVKSKLTSYFDEVFYMEKKNDGTNIQTYFVTSDTMGLAKDRSGKLMQKEYPDLLQIEKKILGG